MNKKKLSHNDQNLRAYQGVEDLKTFISKKAIEKYRQERKFFAAAAVSFLNKKMGEKRPVSVLDIGSGSSCFLYALHDAGILSDGVGVEISKARHDFAEQWKKEGKYSSIENVNKDIRKVSFKDRKFDACVILDNTFTYFFPVDPHMPEQVLQLARKVLNKDGWLVLEMPSFVDIRRLCKDGSTHYNWQELPESNKFKYSLYKQDCSLRKDVVCTESRYIYRDQLGDFRKIEYSRMYTASELKRMVLEAGFKKPLFYSGYDETAYHSKESKKILLTCRM